MERLYLAFICISLSFTVGLLSAGAPSFTSLSSVLLFFGLPVSVLTSLGIYGIRTIYLQMRRDVQRSQPKLIAGRGSIGLKE